MVETITIKANKSQLNKALEWSSSRYNSYKKSEAIDLILEDIKKGKDVKRIFPVGSFSESGHLGSFRYEFTIKNKIPVIKKKTSKTIQIIKFKK